jgi:CRP/FNR family transcriptional regulator, anaerobic regulatory protein
MDLCVTCPNRERGFCNAATNAVDFGNGSAGNQFIAVRRGRTIVVQNDPSDQVFVLCDGWAVHLLTLPDGRRQILAFLLPGDLLSPTVIVKDRVDCAALALTDVQLSVLSRSAIRAKVEQDGRFGMTISETLAEKLNEAGQLVAAIAHGSAEERIAYLILHLTRRIRRRSIVRDERYFFPLTQQHIVDAVGLTAVHVSRVLSSFRARGWMMISGGALEIFDRQELKRIGLF